MQLLINFVELFMASSALWWNNFEESYKILYGTPNPDFYSKVSSFGANKIFHRQWLLGMKTVYG